MGHGAARRVRPRPAVRCHHAPTRLSEPHTARARPSRAAGNPVRSSPVGNRGGGRRGRDRGASVDAAPLRRPPPYVQRGLSSL